MKTPKPKAKMKSPPRVFSKTAKLTGELKKPTSRKKLHPHTKAASEPLSYDPALLEDPHIKQALTRAVETSGKTHTPSAPEPHPDADVMQEFAQHAALDVNTPLSELEHVFLYNVVDMRMPAVIAARHAGFANPTKAANFLMQKPEIILAARQRRDEYAQLSKITKDRVTQGFLDAAEMARLQADPASMTKAWIEVAKLHGLYEATKVELNINAKHEVIVKNLQSMSDEELLAMAEGEAPAEVYDGVFDHVKTD